MPSTYTLNNGIEIIATGEQSGTWGDTTNTNFELVDTSLDGQVSVTLAATGSSGSPNTLPVSDGAASNGRNRLVIFGDGGDLGGTVFVQLTPNDAEKIVYVRNNLSGSRSILLFQGTYNSSNDYEVPAGTTAVVFFNGAGSGAVAANVFNNAYFDAITTTTVDTTNIEVTNLKAKDGTAAGSIADSSGVITISSSVLTTADINGGTVDGITSLSMPSGTVDIQATHPTGTSNVGFGSGTFANIEAGGTFNTAMGFNALQDLTTGDGNTAIGYQAALNATTGDSNIAIGRQAIGLGVLTGTNNVAIGYQAGYGLTSGDYNILSGFQAGSNVTTGTGNIFQGFEAGEFATTASFGIAIGHEAIGTGVMTGTGNTAIGRLAGNDLTSGIYNNFLGYNAAGNATEGNYNIAIGYSSIGVGVVTGTDNIAIGRQAGNDISSGNYNVAVGYRAGYELTTGVDNTLLGVQAGDVLTTGSNNTIIGHDAAASAADVANEITLGNTSITAIRAQVTSITAVSDRRDKKDIKDLSVGLDFVNSLNPVEFTWNMRDGAKVGQKEAGFIAQELDEAQQDAGVEELMNLVLKSNPDRLEATPGKLIPVLVRAIQELSDEINILREKLND